MEAKVQETCKYWNVKNILTYVSQSAMLHTKAEATA